MPSKIIYAVSVIIKHLTIQVFYRHKKLSHVWCHAWKCLNKAIRLSSTQFMPCAFIVCRFFSCNILSILSEIAVPDLLNTDNSCCRIIPLHCIFGKVAPNKVEVLIFLSLLHLLIFGGTALLGHFSDCSICLWWMLRQTVSAALDIFYIHLKFRITNLLSCRAYYPKRIN